MLQPMQDWIQYRIFFNEPRFEHNRGVRRIEANAEILDFLNTQNIFINVFYIMIYGIAGFGIANTLIIIVAQRSREIGILKAMGASQKSIMAVFLFQSVILGALGLVLGTILGYIATVALQSYRTRSIRRCISGCRPAP
jgi:lipoprotein-releasing system permease protein